MWAMKSHCHANNIALIIKQLKKTGKIFPKK